jgi:hypothetical protein
MKSLRILMSVVLMLLSTVAFTQSDAHKSDTQKPDTPKSEAQTSFDQLKTLAGSWEGHVTMSPQMANVDGKVMQISFQVTSRGNALMHEMKMAGIPDDPITMFYLDADRLLLTHYCDAGNRPRMVAKLLPDAKTVEFDFIDITGNTQKGHMQHAVFTVIDANHHTEDWTFLLPGDKSFQAHIDLKRVTTTAAAK